MKHFLIVLLFIFSSSLFAQQWEATGGPIGGLGYNIKIDPTNNQIMYITDALSGAHKSIDGGTTWIPKNNGITSRGGQSGDAIPVFTISIDGNNTSTIWAGTQYDSGIYKSTDGAETWVLKNNGITETNLVFREISIVNGNSNIMFASAELPTGIQGTGFEKVKGVIYKSIDAGENWSKIWEGDSLARWICINQNDTDILTVSTGIFDREANNTTGVGIIKSTDGGQTWTQSNTGINGSLFFGGMSDVGNSPNLIYIASGNNAEVDYSSPIKGGVFKSTDFGDTWSQVISPTDVFSTGPSSDIFNIVKIAPSDNNIVYAASSYAFYKTTDAGANWTVYQGGTMITPNSWGPTGIRAGVPIEIVIDKTDPNIVYAANYGGGVFKSTDGAQTWSILGTGYSGAEILKIATDPQNSSAFISIGRSGPFKSTDKGNNYTGLFFAPATAPEWYSVTYHPTDSNIILTSAEIEGFIFKSIDGGSSWTKTFDPNTDKEGAKELVFSKSNPNVVYAGFAYKSFFANPEGTNFGNSIGLYKSVDIGETWTATNMPASTNLNITALAVNDTNENSLYVGFRGDGIFHSTDGGTSWTNIGNSLPEQYIHSIALAENNSIIYVATKSKGLFKSTDNGANWTQILTEVNAGNPEPIKMLSTIAVNPVNQHNIIVADMHTGAYMTTDAGVTWNLINTGLTNRAITTLTFSADGKTLFAGTQGQGVFKYDTSALSIDSTESISLQINLYPNPSNEKITIDLRSISSLNVKVSFYTVLGKKVLQKTITDPTNFIEINTKKLQKGLYLVKITQLNGQSYTTKLLIE